MGRTPEEAVNGYITDMLALEDHIEKALRAQIADFRSEHPEFATRLEPIHRKVRWHIEALKGLSDDRDAGSGNVVAEAVKRANEKLPKDLRDDYAALNLAAIGYIMLLTTARALDDPRVADLAERHLRDHAGSVMTLHGLIPAVVVKLLEEDDLPAHADVLPAIARTLEDAWRSGAREMEEVGGSRR